MFTPSIASLARIVRPFRRFRQHSSGTAAIEFAILVPVMIALYIAAAEIGNMLTVGRRADQVAYTLADLVAQEKSISAAEIRNVAQAAKIILDPYPVGDLKMVLTSVVADNKNRPKIAWSCGYNGGTAHGSSDKIALPEGVTEEGSSVIVAEVQYTYTPMLGEVALLGQDKPIFTTNPISRTFYSRPRRSASVEKTDNGC